MGYFNAWKNGFKFFVMSLIIAFATGVSTGAVDFVLSMFFDLGLVWVSVASSLLVGVPVAGWIASMFNFN